MRFLIGVFVGAVLGIALMCIVSANKEKNDA